MNRAFIVFWFASAIGFLGVSDGACQTATPAPPSAPRPPNRAGANRETTNNSPQTAPTPVRAKPFTVQKPAVTAVNQKAKDAAPERTRLIAIFHGTGAFDDGTAEKLRPVLTKTFHPEASSQADANGGKTQGPGKSRGPDALSAAAAFVKAVTP